MSRKFIVLSALALGLMVPASAKVYTRDEAIKTAMENAPDIKSAEEELIKATSQVEAGYGNAYPSIDLNATVTRIFGLDDVKAGTPITDAAKDSSSEANKFDKNVLAPALDKMINGMSAQGYRWQSSIGLTVTQVLYAAGKVGTAIDIAKAYKHLQEVALEGTKTAVRFAVNTAIDQMILVDSSFAIIDESIQLYKENLEFVKQNVQSGLATELDLARIQLALDGALAERKSLDDNMVVAKNAFLTAMGVDYDNDVQFQGELRSPDSNLPYPDTCLANVKKRLNQYQMLEATEIMKKKNIEIEEGGYKPTVALLGGLKYTNNQNEFYKWDAPKWDKLNKYVALNVSMNLFNGMQTTEAIVQAKSSLRSTQIQKETSERQMRVTIENNAKALESVERTLVLLKGNINLAQRIYEITEASYKNGMETQINLLAANLELRQAKLKYLQAVVQWNTAYNALLMATGEY